MKIPRRMKCLALVALVGAGAVHLRAQTNAPAEDKPKWQSSAAAGLTLTRGNGETLLATLSASTGRKTKYNEFSAALDGTYGESKSPGQTNSVVNANAIHGFIQYNRLFSERLFGYARVEGLHDEIAEVKYRATLSPGAGYYLIKQKGTDLCMEIGPSYIIQKLDDNSQDGHASLRVADKFTHDISDHARLWQSAEFLPNVEHFNIYLINAEVGIEADLTKDKRLTLRAVVQDMYNSNPAADRKKNDVRLITQLAYKF